MRFPANVREDMLEFLGATPIEDAQLKQMIADVTAHLNESRHGDGRNATRA